LCLYVFSDGPANPATLYSCMQIQGFGFNLTVLPAMEPITQARSLPGLILGPDLSDK